MIYMTELQRAKDNLKKVEEELNELKQKMYSTQRERSSIREDIEKEMNGNLDINNISEFKIKLEAAGDIIEELKKKIDYQQKYILTKAEEKLDNTKAKALSYENQINDNLILIEMKQKELDKIQFEANRLQDVIEKRKKNIEDLKEQFPSIIDRDINILEGHRLQKAIVKALNERLTGRSVDKKFEF